MQSKLPVCPVEITLTLIDDRWKVLILRELLSGTKRFSELQNALGRVSSKVLTSNLRSMEFDGLITRQIYPVIPPKVEYTLTETGFSLEPILIAMMTCGLNYKEKLISSPPIQMHK